MKTKRNKPPVAKTSFEQDLQKRLKSKRYCIGYLDAAAHEGTAVFRRALKDIASVWLPKGLSLVLLAIGVTGCIRPAIKSTCRETGRYVSSCSSSRYGSWCNSGPEVSCLRRWFWQQDTDELVEAALREQREKGG